jgi:hypothetical protein
MGTEMDDAGMYRDLTKAEVLEFEQWVEDNFTPGVDEIKEVWHPVCKAKAKEMEEEAKDMIGNMFINSDNEF